MNNCIKRLSLNHPLLWGGIVATISLHSFTSPALSAPQPEVLEDNPKAMVDEMWQIVNNEFVDRNFNRVDWQEKRRELLSQDYANPKQAYKAIRDALKDLGDPYTRFLPPNEFSVLTSQTSGELSGVGVRLALDKRTSQLYVVEAVRNSPAMEAGLKRGDRLIRINGKPTALMTLDQAQEEITGEVGTEVSLQLSRREKGVFQVTLKRAQIEIASVTYYLKEDEKHRIGYIKLDEFSSHAAEQMKQAIEELGQQQVSGFILDLRGNPGGLLFSSVDIARLWLQKGEIVSTIDRKGGDRHFSANGTSITDLPLVILVDEGSASASEILTGALKENGRATIVGTTTYGKGTVQSVHSLSDGSGLAVTIARYYPPSGTDINHKGINPDVYLDLTMDQQVQLRNDPTLMGTDADPQYNRALSILKSESAPLSTPATPKPVGLRWQQLRQTVQDPNPRWERMQEKVTDN
ncbi:carboxyl-terminal processing protease CtpB [Crocosphaera sp. XPORK-15E]|uniref:carboxyl-terminal processing protease CtpB n=1 Tax=Crocosphaera sp. XPORK-15E TaxID=3110247 RepID=UPI002B1FFAD8|nr:carboxyl-terminal processing protease CtpB [Crocosphaera sp. XPORK-15E]MEA5533845.1 S41 family peptidase [Crocosphaera sp. XPORK-15E]